MTEFSKLEYKRPDIKEFKKKLSAFVAAFKKAASYEEAKSLYFEIQTLTEGFETQYSLAYIRNTLDTSDAFYEAEMDFFNKALPTLASVQKKLCRALLETVFRPDFELEYGSQMFELLEADEQLQSLLAAPLFVRESLLETKYSKLVAGADCEFKGERCNLYGLLRHMQST
ncbi:MAG: hypothetical protein Q4B42_07345, partial [Oscillospiraceae bacterium]|nr:hypothetical protein [Oscillospiraceae bacterium]